ncbi:hypothetical protein D3C72_904620 [compost metagenome]
MASSAQVASRPVRPSAVWRRSASQPNTVAGPRTRPITAASALARSAAGASIASSRRGAWRVIRPPMAVRSTGSTLPVAFSAALNSSDSLNAIFSRACRTALPQALSARSGRVMSISARVSAHQSRSAFSRAASAPGAVGSKAAASAARWARAVTTRSTKTASSLSPTTVSRPAAGVASATRRNIIRASDRWAK